MSTEIELVLQLHLRKTIWEKLMWKTERSTWETVRRVSGMASFLWWYVTCQDQVSSIAELWPLSLTDGTGNREEQVSPIHVSYHTTFCWFTFKTWASTVLISPSAMHCCELNWCHVKIGPLFQDDQIISPALKNIANVADIIFQFFLDQDATRMLTLLKQRKISCLLKVRLFILKFRVQNNFDILTDSHTSQAPKEHKVKGTCLLSFYGV